MFDGLIERSSVAIVPMVENQSDWWWTKKGDVARARCKFQFPMTTRFIGIRDRGRCEMLAEEDPREVEGVET